MAREECCHPLPTVAGGVAIVPDLHRSPRSQRRHHAFVLAHEAVPRIGIKLHVAIDAELAEQLVEPLTLRRVNPIQPAVTRDHRANPSSASEVLGTSP